MSEQTEDIELDAFGARVYRDLENNPRSIRGMIKHESEWVASRFQYMEARIADLEADQPPAGFPSWEDWLASKFYETHRIFVGGEWRWAVYHKGVRLHGNPSVPDFFPDYPTALAAAKKEAQNAK